MRNQFSIKKFYLLALMAIMGAGQVFAGGGGGSTYYSALTMSVKTGSGTVYADQNKAEGTTDTYYVANGSQSHSYTIHAQAAEGYFFDKWEVGGKAQLVTNSSDGTVTIQSSSTNNNSPTTGTVSATFVAGTAYYAKVDASVFPTGSGNVNGEISTKKGWVHPSETSTVISFTLTATPNTNYSFIGWSTSQNEKDIFATEATHNFTVTTTSKTEGSPTTVTYYALFAQQVATPVIGIDKSTGSTTITCSTDGATIYYTTDGSNPTTSSTPYGGAFTVTEGTVVKAIAVKDGYKNSAIATQSYTTSGPTGISGGVVTLNDLEDHNWTYYSGVDRTIDGGNYNDNYAGKLYSPNPRNVKITYTANGGAVSIDESETSFVYYKTLEQGTTSGQYPYTVISNPFSKRPTGKGFGGWKIISGGEYINGYNNGSTLPLDQEITFVNLPYTSTNCISAEIKFEATWVNLNNIVRRTDTGNYTYSTSDGTYETNILVLKGNQTGAITVNSPCTIMMVEPDGSGDYRSNTFSGNITHGNIGVTKIEFAKWTTTSNIDAAGKNFTIGRGIQRPSGGSTLYGTNNSSNSINQTFKIESGIWKNFYAIGSSGPSNSMTKQHIVFGNDYDRANKGNNDNLVLTNSFLLLDKNATVGQDKLVVTVKSGKITRDLDHSTAGASGNCCYLWDNGGDGNGSRELIVEGGEMWHIAGGYDKNNSESSTNLKIRVKGGTIHGSIYGGAAKYDTKGYKQFIFTGGTVEGWIAGGSNGYLATGSNSLNGTVTGRSYVYVGGRTQVTSGNSTTAIDMSVGGNVYGAGCGNTTVNNSGRVTNQTNVVIADECYVQRGVYGGGAYGSSPGTANVYITGNAHVGGVYESTFDVYGGVYGGARAKDGGSTNIYMTGGYVEHGVYGGSNLTGTISNNVTMQINGGQVGTSSKSANIHGGGYGQATQVSGNVKVTLGTEKQATGGVTVYGDVYGGSALGTVNSDANDHTYVTMHKGTINGSLYGGGLGNTSVAANVNGPVKVEVHGGSVKATSAAGSGGVYGANNINGAPQRSVTVDIYGTDRAPAEGEYALYAVYGGGNQADYLYGNGYPTVTVHGCDNSIEYVYGGGNAAAVKTTNVTIWGGDVIGNVFGGGHGYKNGAGADVEGDVNVAIKGGTIKRVFGGSNSKGNISGTINLEIDKDGGCDMRIGEVYGGGNEAAGNAGTITIGCTGALVEGNEGHVAHPEEIGKTLEGIGAVYGGANNANIGNDITLNINSGMVARVFGGNNTGGSVNGNVTVNVNKDEKTCGWYVGKVHGGGYGSQTSVTGDVTVNIENGTIYGDVYGGSALGKVNSNTTNTTTVNLNGGVIKGDAYGGGLGDSTTEADVNGNVIVTLNGTAFELTTTTDDQGNTIPTSGRIFGCNNINGSPKGTVLVKVLQTVARNSDGTLKDKPGIGSGVYELQAVYGGGNLAAYNPTDPEADGQFTSYTWGEKDVAHVNTKKPVQVVIDGCDETSIEYVYGGGNAAATPATDVTVLGSYEIGSVFGGGNGKDRYTLNGGTTWNENLGADVGIINATAYKANNSKGKYGTGDAMTSVLGGTVHNIFGGSNTLGNIVGEATAYLDAASDCKLNVDGIYGGGNEADMDGSSGIQLGCIESLKEIYGGARKADVGGDINLTITSGHFGRVFGGNNLGGLVKGSITVNIEETGCNPITIGELYGCGNKAAYKTPGDRHPTINIRSFTSIGNVYGGGLGKEAVVEGNPTININVVKGANNAVEDWSYNGKTIDFGDGSTVTLPLHETGKIGAIGNVFGGGNAAEVIGNTQVNIGTETSVVFESLTGAERTKDVEGADIRGNVYGGGNQANVTGKTNVVIGKK